MMFSSWLSRRLRKRARRTGFDQLGGNHFCFAIAIAAGCGAGPGACASAACEALDAIRRRAWHSVALISGSGLHRVAGLFTLVIIFVKVA